ncbi:MAG: lyase [Gammaproteobacteria bacterium]|nr:lyase [Gammaproteobacteria bacterium]
MKSLCSAMVAVSLMLLAAPVSGFAQENDPTLEEWVVPWEQSRPRDPYVAPDGRVWFAGQRSHYAAVLDPATGEMEKFDLPDGAGPHTVVVADDGMVWYTGNLVGNLGRLDPETGDIEIFPMPDERARDPHTFAFDAAGDLWFTVQGGNFVGKFWKESGEVRLVEMPNNPGARGGSTRPYGLKMDSRDRPWASLFGTNMLVMVDPETFEPTYFELPEGARPRRLVIDSNDIAWYVDYARGFLGRVDPATGEVTEWANPSGGDARPYGVAIDNDDRVWFVETGVQPNMFVGFDTRTEEYISSVAVESGGGTIRHMYYDADNNVVWFGADTNTIGRAVLPPSRPVSF